MIDEVTRKILDVVSRSDYIKGLNYDENMIRVGGVANITDQKRFQFIVHSESSNRKYMVQIIEKNNKIQDTYCTCPQFEGTGSCKHVAACLTCYSDQIIKSHSDNSVKQKTKSIFRRLQEEFESEEKIKEEVFAVPSITKETGYYYNTVSLKVKIGQDKMYSLVGKYNVFIQSVRREEPYYFGTHFTYDPKKHYFSEQTLALFRIMDNLLYRRYANGNAIPLDDYSLKEILKLYPQGICVEDAKETSPIVNGFPISMKLSKENEQYRLELMKDMNSIETLTDDLEYVYDGLNIYHLNKKQRILFDFLCDNHLQEMVFSATDFMDFQKSILRVIKENLVLDDSVQDLVISSKPEVKIYFDLNEDDIVCNPKFLYRGEEISYFDATPQIIRDVDFESEVIQTIKSYGFEEGKHEFVLMSFDLLCEFMDTGLDEISEKYPVYTSEKLKNTKVMKNNSVGSHFTIGKDQILHYDFDLEGVDTSELENILASMKDKKKYYRLKNGNILSLEQEELKELNDLTTELELSANGGTIPKYRALYLDSLKQKKYGIIKTDSLFQEFIRNFKAFQNTEVSFTKEELDVLRDYQVNGVKWLYTVCKCGFGGILADEMGLGKSLQTICFFQKILKEEPEALFLIVCPTSLIYNWENEILKFAPSLKYEVFGSSRNERRERIQKFKGNIYITSYGLLREDLELYKEKNFRIFIIDEAQNIKNPKTGLAHAVKSVNAETKMALTGTPIENSIVELWSIFDFIMPGFLSSLMKFQQKYKIKDSFDDETNQLLSNLRTQIQPFILRRKKKDVVKDLPDKIENNIYIDLTEEQKKLYAAEVKFVNDEMDKMIKQSGFTKNKMMILSLLTRLRQICIDPRIVLQNYNGGSAKIENLIKIMKEVVENGHKILLFTSFKTALEIVKEEITKEGITSYTIAGDVPSKTRAMLVDAFNKDNTNVFLIMLKSGGTGLNLTSADVVIHLDLWWNPQAENQATDRTHRIGQTKNVEVIKLICKGTIEEKILKLQEKKKLLSDKMIEDGLSDQEILKNMTEQDIRDLLAYENKD